MGLASRVDLGAEVGGGGAGLGEVAGEDWLEKRAEDDLGAAVGCQYSHGGQVGWLYVRSLGQGHPEDQNELEGVVEG